MKKLLNLSLVLAAVLTAATTNVAVAATKSVTPVSEINKPFVTSANSMVSVRILNAVQSPVKVKIMELDGTPIYAGTFDSKNSFFKKFDISEFPSGKYVFEFTYNNTTYTETVSKK